MTKEEREKAIDLLDNLLGMVEDNQDNDYDKALKMGIESLRKEPCADAISKASVFEILGNLMSIPYDFDRRITEKDVSESMDEIRDLPSVTPTRKKGKWIRKPIRNAKGGCVSAEMICTCCGKDNNCDKKLNYCPNCGAEMESEPLLNYADQDTMKPAT